MEADLFTRYYQALLFDSKDHYHHCIKQLTEYITNNSRNAFVFNNRGVAYSEIGKVSEARNDFIESANIARNPIPFKNLGMMLECNDMNEEAIGAFHNAILLDPKDASLFRCRAHSFVKLKKTQE